MVRAVGENTFQPKIGFKTRYGMIRNPFSQEAATIPTGNPSTTTLGISPEAGEKDANVYYRRVQVANLM